MILDSWILYEFILIHLNQLKDFRLLYTTCRMMHQILKSDKGQMHIKRISIIIPVCNITYILPKQVASIQHMHHILNQCPSIARYGPVCEQQWPLNVYYVHVPHNNIIPVMMNEDVISMFSNHEFYFENIDFKQYAQLCYNTNYSKVYTTNYPNIDEYYTVHYNQQIEQILEFSDPLYDWLRGAELSQYAERYYSEHMLHKWILFRLYTIIAYNLSASILCKNNEVDQKEFTSFKATCLKRLVLYKDEIESKLTSYQQDIATHLEAACNVPEITKVLSRMSLGQLSIVS